MLIAIDLFLAPARRCWRLVRGGRHQRRRLPRHHGLIGIANAFEMPCARPVRVIVEERALVTSALASAPWCSTSAAWSGRHRRAGAAYLSERGASCSTRSAMPASSLRCCIACRRGAALSGCGRAELRRQHDVILAFPAVRYLLPTVSRRPVRHALRAAMPSIAAISSTAAPPPSAAHERCAVGALVSAAYLCCSHATAARSVS